MIGLRTVKQARTLMKINEMYVNKVRPSIYRSRDGSLDSYVNYRTGYQLPDNTLEGWVNIVEQTNKIVKDIDKCSEEFPDQYISLVGKCPNSDVVEVLHMCYRPKYLDTTYPNDVY